MSTTFSDIAVLNVNGVDYRCIITWISKNETADLLQKADLNEESKTLQIKKIYTQIWKWVQKF